MKQNKIWSVILLISMLALAGCPDMVQQDSGSAPSAPRERGGGGGE